MSTDPLDSSGEGRVDVDAKSVDDTNCKGSIRKSRGSGLPVDQEEGARLVPVQIIRSLDVQKILMRFP